MAEPLLRMTGISKRFPGVRALDDVQLEVGRGEIHALLGENGAGKSTLLKILSGAQPPDSGEIVFGGEPVTFDSPHDAQRLGIYVNPGDFTHIAQTANGTARVAPVKISRISIGDITVRNVSAVVSEQGKSERTLLGMSFLGRLSRVEMRGGTLVLQE